MPYILKAQELETRANKVTVLDETVTDNQYPSAKAVRDALSQFTPSANPDTVVGQRTEDGGEIFNDYKNNKATGIHSHSEGTKTNASGNVSHASGYKTTAGYYNQFVCGRLNDNKDGTLFEVGNGDDMDEIYSNAFEVYSDGHAEVQKMGDSDNSVATKKYVDSVAGSGSGGEGSPGEDGATFTPNVSPEGVLSWTNDKGLNNPDPVSIKGEKGDQGIQGIQGIQGERGLQGEQGIQGIQGEKGADGAKGDKGDKGDKGETGATGSAGKDGANGKDGVSVTHSWNGTTLTVTSASGTSSANLKGEKGDTGSQGKKGDKGDKGDTGSKGADGEDYIITASDKQEIKNDILSSIITQKAGESESLVMSQKAVTDLVNNALAESETTEFETVDSIEEMTDTSKQYVLSTDGYIYTYTEKTETVYHEAENKFVPADAQINKRMGSSSLSAQNGYVCTGAIPVDLTKESPFRVKVEGTKITETGGTNANAYQKIWLCADNTGTTKLSAAVLLKGENSSNYAPLDANGIIHADYKANAKLSDSIISGTKYLRIGFKFSDSEIGSTSELSGVKITFPCEAYSEEVTTSKWVCTEMKPTEVGGDNYVDLLVKVNQNKTDIAEVSNRVTAIENGSDTVTIPSFWESAVNTCISKIKALQVGKNCVTFPFFSDNHQRNGYAGMLIAKVMKECNIPYCFFGGDSISSDVVANEATMIAQDKAFDTMMSYVPNGRLCRAVGNHDGYWYDGTNKYYYNRDQVYDLFLREESIAQNKLFGENGTYYYVDDIASKVRFVVLNTNVHRDTNGNVVGNNVETEQLSWLQNVALSFSESGWGVVFISHQPISNHYHANISNAEAIRTVVKNYINGSSSNKADVIGWYSGHIHRDRIYTGIATNTTDDSQGTAMGFTQVTITSDHTSIAYDDTTKHTVANDDKSHAIDFVTINKATRTVNITRLGSGSDRSYTY